MKKFISMILVLAMVFSLAACGGSSQGQGGDDSQGEETKNWNIAVVPKEVTAEWFKRLEVGVVDYANDHPEVTVTYKGPDTTDAALQ